MSAGLVSAVISERPPRTLPPSRLKPACADTAPIQVARPRLPGTQAILPYLAQIEANAWYSNYGPLMQSFERRLATHWGLPSDDVVVLSNATVALTLALLASGVRPGRHCLMPSWTFVASACAVQKAGLVPHFVDVCRETWAPDPDEIRALAARHDVGAILIVAPFGAPLDLAAWDAVQQDTGVPVIIDGAAAFDTLRADGPMRPGVCPIAVSLHATKVFGVGEGGALICRDRAMLERVRRLSQFGFLGSRDSVLPGTNAKLSEYAAAVGLASLDVWEETRARWVSVTRRYAALPDAISLPPDFGAAWVSSTLNVLWPAERLDGLKKLAGRGVASLRWWGPGCHGQTAFRDCPAEKLPVTTELAARSIGLPFWQDLSATQIETVCQAVAGCIAGPRRRARVSLPATGTIRLPRHNGWAPQVGTA